MAHDGHGSTVAPGDESQMHMMKMWFHGGTDETILFKFWKTEQIGGFLGSMALIFLLSILYEALKFYRETLFKNYFETRHVGLGNEEVGILRVEMLSKFHAFQTFLHMVQFVVSYGLMLIFMTFNIWLGLSITLGAAVGYFFFGHFKLK